MQDGANVPVIEPRVVHEVISAPDRNAGAPVVQFGGDSLFVLEPVWNDPPTRILWWYAPNVATVALLLLVVALVWTLRRAIASPRRKGVIYCRGCNSELGLPHAGLGPNGRAAWLSEDARCPECGKRLRSPVVGAGRGWRWLPPLVMLVGIMCCAGAYWKTLVWHNPTMPQVYKTWPWEGLEKRLGTWAVMRADVGSVSSGMTRVVRAPLPNSAKAQVFRSNMFTWNVDVVSSDGRYLAWVSRYPTGTLWIGNTTTGGVAPIVLDEDSRARARVCGFSSDGRFVYVQVGTFPKVKPDSLVEVELATGRQRVIASVMDDANLVASTQGSVISRFVVRDHPDGLVWAHVAFDPSSIGRSTPVTVQVPAADGLRKFVVSIADPFKSRLFWHPNLRGLVVVDGWWRSMIDVIVVDGGATTNEFQLFPFGGIERAVRVRTERSDGAILQKDGVRLGTLRGAGLAEASGNMFTVSPNGKWAAAVIYTPRLAGSRPETLPIVKPGARWEVWVWDLESARSLNEHK